jgi:hypothetical protein
MTVFRLYEQNGNCAGFWVQHRLWTNTCARVITVNGTRFGELPHGDKRHPDAAFTLEAFDVRSGRPSDPAIPCADDNGFVRIADPAWSRCR